MPNSNYDLFVIGAGSGGVRAARLAAQAGARVGIAEESRIGGTCVIRGCVPKKLLVYGSEFSQTFRDAKGFGWSVDWARFDWPTLRDNVQNEVSRLEAAYRRNLTNAGAAIFEDRAVVLDAQNVRLEKAGAAFSVDRILVATGGRPVVPDTLKGHEFAITSDEVFTLPELPARVLIVGGGYIAVEFASIFSGLGAETILAYRGELILRGFDEDVRKHVQDDMKRTGVEVLTQVVPTEIKQVGARKLVTLSDKKQYEVDVVLFAVGRRPHTPGLGLEQAGVALKENGAVIVDEHSRTNVPSIWAVGDVTDRINLTPVAIREGQAFAQTEFMQMPTAFDHADVPSAVFSRPPIGAVGLTETQARERHGGAIVYKTAFRPMKHIVAGNEQRTLMKMIVHPSDNRVLGIHIAGPDAPEMIQVAAVAVKAGLTKRQWDETCALHPTAAEELVLMHAPLHDTVGPA